MTIKEQILHAADLLAKNGCTDEEVAYYKAAAPKAARRVIELLANHFPKLLQLAYKNGKTDDSKKAVKFSIGGKLDVTEIEKYDLQLAMIYNESFKQTTSVQGDVDEQPEDDDEEEDPLFKHAAETDAPSAEPSVPVSEDLPEDPQPESEATETEVGSEDLAEDPQGEQEPSLPEDPPEDAEKALEPAQVAS